MMSALDLSFRPLRTVLANTSALIWTAFSVALVMAAVLVARISSIGFVLVAVALLATFVVGALRWPRAMLVLVVLGPIVDRFLLVPAMPSQFQWIAQYAAEALLVVVGAVLVVVGIRSGRLFLALRHPASVGLGVFLAVALLSALLNGVPPFVAAAGVVYTFDAIVVFYLSRIVGFDHRQTVQAIGAVGVAVLLLVLVAIGQALLDPNLFGLAVVAGRSGVDVRIGSLVHDPNILGTLAGVVLPFALFGAVHLQRPRWQLAMGAAALAIGVALLLTYSRGSWLGVVAGGGLVILMLDRRVLAVAALIAVVALGVASFMPRNLLVHPTAGAPSQPAEFDFVGTTGQRIGAVGAGRDLRTLFVLNALPILRDYPLIGVGPGRYGGAAAYTFRTPIYDEYDTWKLLTAQRTVDNFWLHILIESGILGTLAFISALAALGVGLFKAASRATGSRYVLVAGILAAAASVTVSTGTTMLLEGNTVAFIFWFLLGIGSLRQPLGLESSRAQSRKTDAHSEDRRHKVQPDDHSPMGQLLPQELEAEVPNMRGGD